MASTPRKLVVCRNFQWFDFYMRNRNPSEYTCIATDFVDGIDKTRGRRLTQDDVVLVGDWYRGKHATEVEHSLRAAGFSFDV